MAPTRDARPEPKRRHKPRSRPGPVTEAAVSLAASRQDVDERARSATAPSPTTPRTEYAASHALLRRGQTRRPAHSTNVTPAAHPRAASLDPVRTGPLPASPSPTAARFMAGGSGLVGLRAATPIPKDLLADPVEAGGAG